MRQLRCWLVLGKGRPVCEANFRRFGQIPHGARLLGKDTDLYQSFDLARSVMVEVISNGATETRLFLHHDGARRPTLTASNVA